jgi:hypothetical protein
VQAEKAAEKAKLVTSRVRQVIQHTRQLNIDMPNNNNNIRFCPRVGEQNGSRVYQLSLNSMQILLVTNISKMAVIDGSIMDPGKSSPSTKWKGSVIGDKQLRKKTAEVGPSATGKSTHKGKHKHGMEKKPDESAMDVSTE